MGPDPLFARFGREFPEGHVLFREGDAGAVMYVIHEGRVRISRTLGNVERTLAVLGPGDFFGEMAILNQKPRAANAVALEPLQVVEIDARTLEAMVLGKTEIAVRLITRLARRLDSANELVEMLLHRDPRVRVVIALARLAEEFGADDGSALPLVTAEIARAAGLSDDDTAPVLRRLARVRLLSTLDDGTWVVPPATTLRALLAHIDADPETPPRTPSTLPVPVHGPEAPRGAR